MRTVLVSLCLLAIVYCQTQNKNGNPTGEIGQPAFDEIVVASTLTVRGKSGSRSGKSLVTNPKPIETAAKERKDEVGTTDGASVSLARQRRESRWVPLHSDGDQNEFGFGSAKVKTLQIGLSKTYFLAK